MLLSGAHVFKESVFVRLTEPGVRAGVGPASERVARSRFAIR